MLANLAPLVSIVSVPHEAGCGLECLHAVRLQFSSRLSTLVDWQAQNPDTLVPKFCSERHLVLCLELSHAPRSRHFLLRCRP
jgi:hypothetical protein